MDLCIHRKIFAAIAITFSLSGCFNNGFEGLAEVSQTSAISEGTFQFSSTGSLLPQAYTGDVYTVMFATSNGVEPVSFSVTSGSLPPGVTLTNYGLLSGMLTASPGDFSFTVQARDAEGSLATKDFSLKVSVPFTFTTRGLPNAILGANYTAVLTAAGGTPPYTFSATGLPAAFTLNPAIGLITGTPTTAGSATVSVTVTDANGWQESGDILLNSIVPVSAVPSITTSSLPNGVVNSNYAGILVVSGGVAPYRFAVASGSLPAGLTLDTNTGLILGTPQTIGVTPFAIRATDAVGATSVVNYTVTVTAPPAPTITTYSLQGGTVGTTYAQVVAASSGLSPYTYSIASGSLPAGLSLDTTSGIISGTPATPGNSTFSVRVTDSLGSTGNRSFSIAVTAPNAPIITTSSVANAVAGSSYVQVIGVTLGVTPYTFSVSGSLPAGLSIDSSSGIITGTPTATGTQNFVVSVTDAISSTASRSYSISVANVSMPLIASSSLASGVTGSSYMQVLQASGGASPYTFTLTSGTLPAGLTITESTGTISGTPIVAGTSSLTFRVTDANSNSATKTLTLTIMAATVPQIATTSLPAGLVGTAYATILSGVNGVTPYTYELVSGSLPAGLTLNTSSGAISGTPTTAGAVSLNFKITDSVGGTSNKVLSLLVAAPNPPVFATTTLPNATTNAVYAQALLVNSGVQPFEFSVSSGSLPTGISLNTSSGILSGTPTTAGTSSFTVSVTDRVGATASQALTLTVANPAAPTITTTALAAGTAGSPYMQVLQSSGGYAPVTFSLVSGTLPSGLSFAGATGTLSGIPTISGTGSLTFRVTDALGSSSSTVLNLQVLRPAAPVITTSSLPAGTQTVAYAQVIGATGGVPPYSFAVTEGSLPSGLSIDSASGTITGTPSASGSSSFTVTVTDTINGSVSKVFSLAINAPAAPSIINSTLSGGQVTVPYSQAVLASGGVPPYSFSVSSGALPSGITLSTSTGALTGTPTSSGTFNFSIRVQDTASGAATQSYTLAINPSPYAPLTFSTTSLLPLVVNMSNSRTISVTGGLPPYTYALGFGSLPSGMTLNTSTGTISGTPSATGTSSFTVQVTDSRNTSATQSLSLSVVQPLQLTTLTVPGALSGAAYATALSATGGTAPYTYSVAGLPSGLTHTSSGLISGSTTAVGSYSMTVTVSDANGISAQAALTMYVATPLSITTNSSLSHAGINRSYSATIATSGGVSPLSFYVSSGSLPAGLSLNSTTGAITGTPAPGANIRAGSATFTVTVGDSAGQSVNRSFTINLSIPPTISDNIMGRLRTAAVGVPYLDSVRVTGGIGSLLYTASNLPDGLTLNPISGFISGTPTGNAVGGQSGAGNYNASITVTDTRGFATTRTKPIKLVSSTGAGTFSANKTAGFDTGVNSPLNPSPASAASNVRQSAYDLALGDLNGDGLPDMVSAVRNTSEIAVGLNRGDGTFTMYFYSNTGARFARNIYLQDLDGDGRLDVVLVVRDTVSQIEIIKGDGNWTQNCTNQVCGAALTRQLITTGLNVPHQIAFGDINGDGKLDLAVSNSTGNNIAIYMNCTSATTVNYNGVSNTSCNNTAQTIFNYYSGVSYALTSATGVALVNLRGLNPPVLDLVATQGGTKNINTFLGTSATAGTFATTPSFTYSGFASGSGANQIRSTLDFNSDGKRDILIEGSDGAYVVFGSGTGNYTGFSQLISTDIGGSFLAAAGDIRNVGCPDVVTLSYFGSSRYSTQIFQNNCSGLFPVRRVLNTGSSGGVGLAANVFGQGGSTPTLDLVISSSPADNYNFNSARIVSYRNNGTSSAFNGTTSTVMTAVNAPVAASSGPFFFAAGPVYDAYVSGAPLIGDLNNDGFADFIGKVGGAIGTVYLGSATGVFTYVPASGIQTGEIAATTSASRQTLLADLNADGTQDYIAANYNGNSFGSISINVGVGDGTFVGKGLLLIDQSGCTFSQGARSLASADINKDGKLDLIIGHGCNNSSRVSIFYGEGDGSFGSTPTIVVPGTGNAVDQIVVSDIDFDGNADLILGTNTPSLATIRGRGDGTFFAPTIYTLSIAANMSHLDVADINSDGTLDYIFSSSSGSTWGYMLGGLPITGAFTGAPLYGTNYNYNAVRVVDWNDDGRLDVLAWKRAMGVQFFLNSGGATIFTTPSVSYAVQNPGENVTGSNPAIGDLNGDGLPDMLTGGLEDRACNSFGVSYNLSR